MKGAIVMARKDKEIEDARRREIESQADENKREKRELERKTDEYLARLRSEEEKCHG
jgi:hypothetical protein